MNYADIKTIDIQDGTGVRVSIYVSGCHFHCKGCHNPEAWDFNYGKPFTEETIDYIIELMNKDYIAGLSILGGEPLEPSNQEGLIPLVKKVKEKYPDKTIWCYTGYDFDKDVLGKMYKEFSYTKEILKDIDIIVDGQFIEDKKIVDLKFRGSTNQRKIDVQASLKSGIGVELKFGDEERYEEFQKQPKVLLYKEFKERSKENTEQEDIAGYEIQISEDSNNVVPVTPGVAIKEVEEQIAAKNIDNKIKTDL